MSDKTITCICGKTLPTNVKIGETYICACNRHYQKGEDPRGYYLECIEDGTYNYFRTYSLD